MHLSLSSSPRSYIEQYNVWCDSRDPCQKLLSSSWLKSLWLVLVPLKILMWCWCVVSMQASKPSGNVKTIVQCSQIGRFLRYMWSVSRTLPWPCRRAGLKFVHSWRLSRYGIHPISRNLWERRLRKSRVSICLPVMWVVKQNWRLSDLTDIPA